MATRDIDRFLRDLGTRHRDRRLAFDPDDETLDLLVDGHKRHRLRMRRRDDDHMQLRRSTERRGRGSRKQRTHAVDLG